MKFYARACGYRFGNFGDELVPWILKHAVGVTDLSPARDFRDADLVSIGSILSEIPHDWNGYVWGTGAMFHHIPIELSRARIRALRGRFSANRVGIPTGGVALGDPGLLVDRIPLAPDLEPRWELSIVPHYVDMNDEGLARYVRAHPEVHVIDPCAPVPEVLSEIRASAMILSSSLHGLVVADSFGIPNRWVWLSDKLAGGAFKFCDYYSAFGIVDPLPIMLPEGYTLERIRMETRKPDSCVMGRIKESLLAAFPDELRPEKPAEGVWEDVSW